MRMPRPWLMWSEKQPWSTSRVLMTLLVGTMCYLSIAKPEKITTTVVALFTGIATTLAGVWGVSKFTSKQQGDKGCNSGTQAISPSTEDKDS